MVPMWKRRSLPARRALITLAVPFCVLACETGGGRSGAMADARRPAAARDAAPRTDARADAQALDGPDLSPPRSDADSPPDGAPPAPDVPRAVTDGAPEPDAAVTLPDAAPEPDAGPRPEVCVGGEDEDHDGRIDCCDPDCEAACPPIDAPAYTEADVQLLFDTHCDVCHMDGRADGTLSLDAPFLLHTLNVGSEQLRTMVYIKAGDRAQSYLFHKLAGTQHEIGGAGANMPFDIGLCREQIERIGRYIDGL